MGRTKVNIDDISGYSYESPITGKGAILTIDSSNGEVSSVVDETPGLITLTIHNVNNPSAVEFYEKNGLGHWERVYIYYYIKSDKSVVWSSTTTFVGNDVAKILIIGK